MGWTKKGQKPTSIVVKNRFFAQELWQLSVKGTRMERNEDGAGLFDFEARMHAHGRMMRAERKGMKEQNAASRERERERREKKERKCERLEC